MSHATVVHCRSEQTNVLDWYQAKGCPAPSAVGSFGAVTMAAERTAGSCNPRYRGLTGAAEGGRRQTISG